MKYSNHGIKCAGVLVTANIFSVYDISGGGSLFKREDIYEHEY
jgi:hypothetical protein